MRRKRNFLDDVGAVFSFCREKVDGKGEDSCCYRLDEQGGLIAAFDGCGGSGAESYEKLGNNTGAYLASRVAAAATLQWYEQQNGADNFDIEALGAHIEESLAVCEGYSNQPQSKIRGSITKTLPTTMAALAIRRVDANTTTMTVISAGDSHLYQLDEEGLKQLNVDDVAGGDAFSNLYDDPPMTNVISLGGGFRLNNRTMPLYGKRVLIAATDGCFGYLRSPMEFELLLLDTLMEAQSVDEWQNKIEAVIDEVAGDDQTLLGLVYGFRDFDELKDEFRLRYIDLSHTLSSIKSDADEFAQRSEIWKRYSSMYYSMLSEDGQY